MLCKNVLADQNHLVFFVEETYSKDVVVPKVSRHSLNLTKRKIILLCVRGYAFIKNLGKWQIPCVSNCSYLEDIVYML